MFDNTAVFAVPRPGSPDRCRAARSALGLADHPGVTYTGLITTRYLLDFGPMFDKGILSRITRPQSLIVLPIPIFVSKVDEDGNEVAGIRMPPVDGPNCHHHRMGPAPCWLQRERRL